MGREGDAEALIEPGLSDQPTEQPESQERARGHQQQALEHMAAFEMTELMGQHGLDFVLVQ